MHSKCRERTVYYFPVPSVFTVQLYQEYSKTSRCLPFLKRSLRLSLKGAAETPASVLRAPERNGAFQPR